MVDTIAAMKKDFANRTDDELRAFYRRDSGRSREYIKGLSREKLIQKIIEVGLTAMRWDRAREDEASGRHNYIPTAEEKMEERKRALSGRIMSDAPEHARRLPEPEPLRMVGSDKIVDVPKDHEIRTILHNEELINYAIPDEPAVRKERQEEAAKVAERLTLTPDEIILNNHEDRLQDNRLHDDIRDGNLHAHRRRQIEVVSEVYVEPSYRHKDVDTETMPQFGKPIEVHVEPSSGNWIGVRPKYRDAETGADGPPKKWAALRQVPIDDESSDDEWNHGEWARGGPRVPDRADIGVGPTLAPILRPLATSAIVAGGAALGVPIHPAVAAVGANLAVNAISKSVEPSTEAANADKTTKTGPSNWDKIANFLGGAGDVLKGVGHGIQQTNYENAMIMNGTPVPPHAARVRRRRYARNRRKSYYKVGDGGLKAVYDRNGALLGHQVLQQEDEYDDDE
jgi:hypothetical protein